MRGRAGGDLAVILQSIPSLYPTTVTKTHHQVQGVATSWTCAVGADGRGISAKNSRADGFLEAGENRSELPGEQNCAGRAQLEVNGCILYGAGRPENQFRFKINR